MAGDEAVHGEDAYAFYGEGQKFLDSSMILDAALVDKDEEAPAEIEAVPTTEPAIEPATETA